MKHYLVLLLLLCAITTGAQELIQQDSSTVSVTPKKPYYERVIAEAGVRVPLGTLADKHGVSPEVGLWFRSRIYKQDMLDVGFTVYVPTENNFFNYSDLGQTYAVRTMGANGTAALRFCKPLESGRLKVEWVSGFGYAFFMFRDKFSGNTSNGYLEKDATKGLSTIAMEQGLRVLLTPMMGVQAHYNYTPYGLFSRHVPQSFGAHSFTVGLYYRQ
jgi:hypothetical protein